MIVVVVHERYQQPGGEDVAVDADIALLESHGHRVVLFERHNDEIANLGVTRRAAVAAGTVWSPSAVRSLLQVIDRARPDVVHVHNTFPLLSPAIYRAATRRGVPVVQTLHNHRLVCANALCLRDGQVCHDCIGRRLPLPAVRYACYRGSRVGTGAVAAMQVVHRARGTWDREVSLHLPVSNYLLRRLVGAGAIPAERAMVRLNHMSSDPGLRSPAADVGYVAWVGRLSVEKGLDVLLRAARLTPQIQIRIVGGGPLRPAMEQLAQDLGATNVKFLGQQPREAALDVLRGARCLALTSISEEPMSLSLIEAAALGVPIVGTDLGGTPEVAIPGTGALVPPGDERALATVLANAEADPVGWWARGKAARRHFEQEFTAARAYETLMTAYRRVGVAVA